MHRASVVISSKIRRLGFDGRSKCLDSIIQRSGQVFFSTQTAKNKKIKSQVLKLLFSKQVAK